MNTDILFADNLDDMISGSFDRYCTHALCREGEASFLMTGEWFRMRKGDCVIFTHNELISKIEISDDFQVTVLYISNSFSFKNIPRNDYDVIGKLTLLRNPIMSLTEREQRIFMEDIELIRRRLTDHTHRFHDELIGCLAKTFVLDLYDFHARIYESPSVSEQNAVLMERFINLLKAGDYRNHREVSYYASRLCITPKYLTRAVWSLFTDSVTCFTVAAVFPAVSVLWAVLRGSVIAACAAAFKVIPPHRSRSRSGLYPFNPFSIRSPFISCPLTGVSPCICLSLPPSAWSWNSRQSQPMSPRRSGRRGTSPGSVRCAPPPHTSPGRR